MVTIVEMSPPVEYDLWGRRLRSGRKGGGSEDPTVVKRALNRALQDFHSRLDATIHWLWANDLPFGVSVSSCIARCRNEWGSHVHEDRAPWTWLRHCVS